MRMRRKKNLAARMEAVSQYILPRPADPAGQRRILAVPSASSLYVELGCGMGSFTCELARRSPHALVVGVERVADALVVAAERAQKTGLPNARFLEGDAALLPEWMSPGEIDRLYINFCDPWPHWKQAPKRLVARGFLALYAPLLSPDGALFFKTDNAPLFAFGQKELHASGWHIEEVIADLPLSPDNIVSDYEARFRAAGVPIAALRARPHERTNVMTPHTISRLNYQA